MKPVTYHSTLHSFKPGTIVAVVRADDGVGRPSVDDIEHALITREVTQIGWVHGLMLNSQNEVVVLVKWAGQVLDPDPSPFHPANLVIIR